MTERPASFPFRADVATHHAPGAGDATDPILLALVGRALDAMQSGASLDLDLLCADHPHLRDAVAEALGLADGLARAGRDLPDDRDLGRVLAKRYRLTARLGRGAMGAVFVARDLDLDREVAVKVFDKLGPRTHNDMVRFAREAKALAALRHPHVVTVFDRGETDDGVAFLVMPRLSGATLAALQADCDETREFRGWLGSHLGGDAAEAESTWLRCAVRWCAQVARGLHAAHQQGILHRDVKPSNIFIDRDGAAILLDFGIAARDGEAALTAHDSTLGTPWYMAPEQATKGKQTAALDVYGVCATLYHLLTGRPPYDGDALQVLAALPHRDPVAPARLRADLPRDLVAIVEQGMQRRPEDRYRDAMSLADDLEAFLAHRPVRARRIGLSGRAWRAVRRAPMRVAAVAAGAVAIAALGVLLPMWELHAARRNSEMAASIMTRLPPLLAVEGAPSDRVLEPLAERQRLLAEFDTLVTVQPEDPLHRLWRGLLRLDSGDRHGAATDLQAVAATRSSPYVAAVAARYAQADPQRSGAEAVSLDDLPAPSSDFDLFLAGLHELRARRPGYDRRALALLDEVAERYVPARELRMIALTAVAETHKENDKFERAVRDANWLEGHYRVPTARVLALRGAALNGLQRYQAALLDLEAADRLRPDRHGVQQNLGVALRRLKRFDEAVKCLERAHELRPRSWNTPYTLAQLQKDLGNYDQALRWCDKCDELASAAPSPDLAWRAPEIRATVLLRRAMSIATPREVALADAAKANELFLAALPHTPEQWVGQLRGRAQLAAALATGDRARALDLQLTQMAATKPDAHQLAALLASVPEGDLPADINRRLRVCLWRMVAGLTEAQPTFAARAMEFAKEQR